MNSLLTDANFVEQLLRNYLLDTHQKEFIVKNYSAGPACSPCTLVAAEIARGALWLELYKTQTAVFVTLYELGPEEGLPSDFSRINCVVSINVHDPNGHHTMREIVEDKLCEKD